nr:MAG TPA: hypothetical protein [Caudoviricetes sp.]
MIDGRGRLFSTSILLLVVKKRSPDVPSVSRYLWRKGTRLYHYTA